MVIRPSLKFIKLGYALVLTLWAAALVTYFVKLPDQPWLPVAPAVLLIWPAARHLRRQFIKATITGDKLRYQTGFLSRSTRTIQLSKVQDVRVDQSLWQRLFGVGNLSIETAGEASRLSIANLDRPQTVADEIIEASQRHEQGKGA